MDSRALDSELERLRSNARVNEGEIVPKLADAGKLRRMDVGCVVSRRPRSHHAHPNPERTTLKADPRTGGADQATEADVAQSDKRLQALWPNRPVDRSLGTDKPYRAQGSAARGCPVIDCRLAN
jgi:hypothetical protein